MENYKIRVNGEAESKEAQELFFELGYEKGVCSTGGYPALIIATPESRFQKTPYSSRATSLNHEAHSQYKEITLPELRDMVVLKRNSIDDATHEDKNDPEFKYRLIDNHWHVITEGNPVWRKDSIDLNEAPLFIKPIEKTEMKAKEYLNKETYAYVKTHDLVSKDSNWIEIPEGAESFNYFGNEGNVFFLKNNSEITLYSNETEDWAWQDWGDIDFDGVVCLWSRHTHPEELPFIDDEPSLNDQYAEIEKVRQSAWKKQEGGSHYKNLKIQPMQYALENKLDYAQANVVKYVTRHKEKNGKEDLLKAIHNLELMIEFYYGDEK